MFEFWNFAPLNSFEILNGVIKILNLYFFIVQVLLLSDGNGDFTRAIGTELDLSDKPVGLGVRSRRYALLAEDGVVKVLNLEEGGAFTNSSAEDMLNVLWGFGEEWAAAIELFLLMSNNTLPRLLTFSCQISDTNALAVWFSALLKNSACFAIR